jgi:hypothetical protein
VSIEIPLTRGLVALVDDADFDLVVVAGKWCAKPDHHTFYARRTPQRDGKQRTVLMHTFITGWGFVDHRNGDGLDNRRSNLRPADNAKNQMNQAMRSNNTSGFKGVSRHRLKWRAEITLGGTRIGLGSFATPQEAARAYDAAAVELFGEYARPNFPQEMSVR